MAKDDDRLLKELYNQGRPHEEEDPPEFSSMMEQARTSSRQKNADQRPLWFAAAAAVLLAVTMALIVMTPAGDKPDHRAEIAESVEPSPAATAVALENGEEWEELLEFADQIWEEEFPTDFLL